MVNAAESFAYDLVKKEPFDPDSTPDRVAPADLWPDSFGTNHATYYMFVDGINGHAVTPRLEGAFRLSDFQLSMTIDGVADFSTVMVRAKLGNAALKVVQTIAKGETIESIRISARRSCRKND